MPDPIDSNGTSPAPPALAENAFEFWFEFASTYSYVAAERIEREASAVGAKVVWRPFLLGPIFHAQLGIKDSPFNVQKVRGAYMWRDLERLCAKHGLPWKKPSVFPRSSLLAARVAVSAQEETWLPSFVREVYRANFAKDLDIGSREVLGGILTALGQSPLDVLARADSEENRGRLRAATERAMALGLFGAPNFVVEGELFFGQDRLEDALAWFKERHPGAAGQAGTR